MKEKVLLYLTDEGLVLYKDSCKDFLHFKGSFEEIQIRLNAYLTLKSSLYLVLDRDCQDNHEEKLPFLFFWDRVRLLFHKKAHCTTQGGYAGFRFFKTGGDSYLRWVHIPSHDPMISWISWVKERSGHIFFMTLEARGFLNQKLSPSKKYHMVFYTLPTHKTRHIIFKGKHLLLSRLSQEEEVKASLHFLSRTHLDIHENLDILKSDFQTLLKYIASQKRPSFPLYSLSLSRDLLVRYGIGSALTLVFLWGAFEIYEGIKFKRLTDFLFSDIESFKTKSNEIKFHLRDEDVFHLRKSLVYYKELKESQKNPLEDFKLLVLLLKSFPIYLETLTWRYEEEPEISLVFLIKNENRKEIIPFFESFLAVCQKSFPKSHIHVLEAPFKSGPQEVFEGFFKDPYPRAHIKISGL